MSKRDKTTLHKWEDIDGASICLRCGASRTTKKDPSTGYDVASYVARNGETHVRYAPPCPGVLPRVELEQHSVDDNGEPVILTCCVCGEDLSAKPSSGWLAWYFTIPATGPFGPVTHIATMCRDTCSEIKELEQKRLGRVRGDHHLDVFIGKNAMVQFNRLIWTYTWDAPTLRKASELFLHLSRITTPLP